MQTVYFSVNYASDEATDRFYLDLCLLPRLPMELRCTAASCAAPPPLAVLLFEAVKCMYRRISNRDTLK